MTNHPIVGPLIPGVSAFVGPVPLTGWSVTV